MVLAVFDDIQQRVISLLRSFLILKAQEGCEHALDVYAVKENYTKTRGTT